MLDLGNIRGRQLGTLITAVQIDPSLFLQEEKHIVTIPKINKLLLLLCGATLHIENITTFVT